MDIEFRYVDHAVDNCVILHLFRTGNGTPRGTVKGPLSPHPSGMGSDFYIEAYMPPDVAFIAAIRLMTCIGAEMIVTGDPLLWSMSWGSLKACIFGETNKLSNSTHSGVPGVAMAAYKFEAAA